MKLTKSIFKTNKKHLTLVFIHCLFLLPPIFVPYTLIQILLNLVLSVIPSCTKFAYLKDLFYVYFIFNQVRIQQIFTDCSISSRLFWQCMPQKNRCSTWPIVFPDFSTSTSASILRGNTNLITFLHCLKLLILFYFFIACGMMFKFFFLAYNAQICWSMPGSFNTSCSINA